MILCGVVRTAQAPPNTPRRPLSETLKRPLTCTFIVNVRYGAPLVVLTLL